MNDTITLGARITDILKDIDSFVWGLPLIILIIVTGIYLSITVRGHQIRHLGKA